MLRLLLSLLSLLVAADACGYQYINQSIKYGTASVKYSSRRLRRGLSYNGTNVPKWVPLNVFTVYHDDVYAQLGEDINRRDLSNYVTRAVRKLAKMLKVRETESVTAKCHSEFPKEHTASYGHNYILFIQVGLHNDTSNLAMARPCDMEDLKVNKATRAVYHQYDPEFATTSDTMQGRPLSGWMSVNLPVFLTRNVRTEADKWVSTMMHEISHALGFTSRLYPSYIDCHDPSGRCNLYPNQLVPFTAPPEMPHEIPGIVKKVDSPLMIRGTEKPHNVYLMTLPSSTKAARDYFNCPTLEGVELENQGGDGTIFSHLEKRIYENEVMGGVRTEVNAFSNITLSIFEDSGWYQVQFSQAEDMEYGKGAGCDFAKKSCGHYRSDPFCDHDLHRCSNNRKAIERCNAFSYTGKMDATYDYFDRKPTPGLVYSPNAIPLDLADYCPFYTITASKGRADSKCSTINTDEHANTSLQIFSKNARCFELQPIEIGKGSTVRKVKKSGLADAITQYSVSHGCYESKCKDGMVWIKTAKSKFYPCYKKDQLIHVDRRLLESDEKVSFQIRCPACGEICDATECKDMTKHADAGKRIGDTESGASFLDRLLGKGAHQAMTTGTVALLLLSIVFVA